MEVTQTPPGVDVGPCRLDSFRFFSHDGEANVEWWRVGMSRCSAGRSRTNREDDMVEELGGVGGGVVSLPYLLLEPLAPPPPGGRSGPFPRSRDHIRLSGRKSLDNFPLVADCGPARPRPSPRLDSLAGPCRSGRA